MPPSRVRRDNNTALARAPNGTLGPKNFRGREASAGQPGCGRGAATKLVDVEELRGTFALTNVRLWWSKIRMLVDKVVVILDSVGV